MRLAELATAAALAALSLFFMSYAVELPIGWVEGAGPGGGALPFWLSVGLLGCAVVTFVRQLRLAPTRTPGGDDFVHPAAFTQLVATAAAIVITAAAFDIVGAYVAIPAFLLAYLRIVGKHDWRLVIPMAVITPVVLFFFFEVALHTLLPKGVTEPLFEPLYALFF
jgi:hypothetical protein